MSQVFILGSSRGLGAELVKFVGNHSSDPIYGWSRKEARMQSLAKTYANFSYRVGDFSRAEEQLRILAEIDSLWDQRPAKLFYVAGGGPYGSFEKIPWHAHEWAWQVSFVFPARLIHHLLNVKLQWQVILVGSSIAEQRADPLAASYSAAKHALYGLFRSIRLENPEFDLRLFSPGYMDTEMLPANALVREKGVYSPDLMAQELWEWSQQAKSALEPPDITGHRVYPPHPSS